MKFIEKKQALSKEIINLLEITNKLDDNVYSQKLHDIDYNLTNDSFKVLVVGMFSRGKSTFINALLERRILPSSKNPTTAVISKITYAKEPRYVINYHHKPAEEISEEAFLTLVAPEEADMEDITSLEQQQAAQERLDEIAEAEIMYPLNLCKDGVEIIDTPGTNDLNALRVEITYNYLAKADAVILVLSATQLLTKSEVDFLNDHLLKNHIGDIFFIINKIDMVKDKEDLAKVILRAQNLLQEILPEEYRDHPRIYPVSGYQVVLYYKCKSEEKLSIKQRRIVPETLEETGFPALKEALTSFLEHEKGDIKLKVYKHRTIEIIQSLRQKYNNKLILANQNIDELNKAIATLKPQITRTYQEADNIINHLKVNLEGYKNNLINEVRLFTSNMRINIKRVIDNYNGPIEAKALEQEVRTQITLDHKALANALGEFQQDYIEEQCQKASKELTKLWQDLNLDFSRDLVPVSTSTTVSKQQVTITTEASSLESPKELQSLGNFMGGFAIGGLLLGAFFPAILFGGVAAYLFGFFDNKLEKFKAKAKQEVESKFSSISDNMVDTILNNYEREIENIVQYMKDSIYTKLDDVRHTLEDALAEKENKANDENKIKQDLKDRLLELDRIELDIKDLIK